MSPVTTAQAIDEVASVSVLAEKRAQHPEIKPDMPVVELNSLGELSVQRLMALIEYLGTLPDRTTHAASSNDLNKHLPAELAYPGNPSMFNALIREGLAANLLEQDMSGKQRHWLKATDLGVKHAASLRAAVAEAPAQPDAPDPTPQLSSNHLQIAGNFSLGLETVGKRIAIMGRSGTGKTSTAWVLAEELIRCDQPVAILDPSGIWWALRCGSDGKSEGYPVMVIGGDNGDISLKVSDAERIAGLLVNERKSMVIDLSEFDDEQIMLFAARFYERVYVLKRRRTMPIMIIADEADLFAPQNALAGDDKELRAAAQACRRVCLKIAKKGRMRGIGQIWITQRPAEFAKGILAQVEALLTGSFIAPQDLDVLKRWLASLRPAEARDVLRKVPALKPGNFVFYSPTWVAGVKIMQVRPRHTFDSSATPEANTEMVQPTAFAEVDLALIEKYFPGRIEEMLELGEIDATLDEIFDDFLDASDIRGDDDLDEGLGFIPESTAGLAPVSTGSGTPGDLEAATMLTKSVIEMSHLTLDLADAEIQIAALRTKLKASKRQGKKHLAYARELELRLAALEEELRSGQIAS